MTRIVYGIRERFRNLKRNPGIALGSFRPLALLIVLFDIFWVAAGTSERVYMDLMSEVKMDVFLSETLPDSALAEMSESIEAVEGVRSVRFVSREEARQELTRHFGADLLVGYDSVNPLPRSYSLAFDPEYLNQEAVIDIENQLSQLEGVDEIAYSRQWFEKTEFTKKIILQLGLALGAIILLTALISSTNNIRLMTKARAVGFRQMALLGAHKLFIGLPFLIEGFLMAGLAAAAGWGAILWGRSQVVFTRFDIVMPSQDEIIVFCVVCAVLGLVSGYLGIRPQLKT